MVWLDIKRIIKSGLQNFFRNGFVSFASVIVMTITLFIIASMMLSGGLLNYGLDYLKQKVDVNVYFVTSANESDILSIQKSLEALPQVASVAYTSQDDALAAFRARHADESLTLAALDELGDNPLEASLNIKAKDPSDYAGIAEFLGGDSTELLSASGQKIIDTVNYAENETVINRLNSIVTSTNKMGTIAAIIFIVLSVLVTFNTIRLTIFMARDEISVMRLVGASNKFVKLPFVVSGVFCGFISAVIVILFFALATFLVNHYASAYLASFNIFAYYMGNFWRIAGIVAGSGVLLGGLASYLATQKYLKD